MVQDKILEAETEMLSEFRIDTESYTPSQKEKIETNSQDIERLKSQFKTTAIKQVAYSCIDELRDYEGLGLEIPKKEYKLSELIRELRLLFDDKNNGAGEYIKEQLGKDYLMGQKAFSHLFRVWFNILRNKKQLGITEAYLAVKENPVNVCFRLYDNSGTIMPEGLLGKETDIEAHEMALHRPNIDKYHEVSINLEPDEPCITIRIQEPDESPQKRKGTGIGLPKSKELAKTYLKGDLSYRNTISQERYSGVIFTLNVLRNNFYTNTRAGRLLSMEG
ncbi:hypothetical protein CMO89_02585 [Candidatus Woesearchaeota archaeon]|nr:hypothetical protein [Candidatus Woesearchaeota archaeon]